MGSGKDLLIVFTISVRQAVTIQKKNRGLQPVEVIHSDPLCGQWVLARWAKPCTSCASRFNRFTRSYRNREATCLAIAEKLAEGIRSGIPRTVRGFLGALGQNTRLGLGLF